MKVWLQIILEWLNCLGILEANIKNLKELEDGKFYRKLLELISWKDKENLDAKDTVIKFLEDEYPEFKIDNSCGDVEQVYIASLYLLNIAQQPLFHQPMCTKLQHETQLKIKTFLELCIPYGKDINRDILREIIGELQNDKAKTPVTPKTRTLKNFLNSPASQSVQSHKTLIERNREIRKLRNELDVERYEKVDLQEDLRIQQSKVQNLQKKLQEKTAELKALRDENAGPNTPQSCKKNRNAIGYEEYYRKEIDCLEDQLMQKQCEIDKIETDSNTLCKKLTSVEKQNTYFQEKLDNYEKSLEKLQIQIEIKDTKLLNFKIANEELRTHLEEISKTAVDEKSFETEEILPFNLSSSLNSSEALSSVIDIQLQEAKEEAATLKIQLNVLNKKLESTSKEYKHATESLNEKTVLLQEHETKLNVNINKFSKEIKSLQEENTCLINENESLKHSCASQKESLSQLEETKCNLSSEVETLKEKTSNLEKSLHSENVENIKLNTELKECKSQVDENLKQIQDLKLQNDSYKKSIECCNKNLKDVFNNLKIICTENVDLNNLENKQLIEYITNAFQNFEEKYVSKEKELQSLNNVMDEIQSKLQQFELQTSELKLKNEENDTEILELKKTITENVTKINELTTDLHKKSQEIEDFKKMEVEKQMLEKDVCVREKELNKQSSLLKSLVICIKILKENWCSLATEFYATKKDILNQVNEYKKENGKTFQNISDAYKALYNNFTEEQNSKKQLQQKLADNEHKLKNSDSLNITLEISLTKYKEKVNNLETELISYKEKLVESEQKSEKLQKMKDILEKQYNSLQSENEKLLLNVNRISDTLKSSQEEVCSVSEQLKLKAKEITNLVTEVTSLKLKKEHLIHLQTEGESKTNNFIKELETMLLEKQRNLDQLNIDIRLKQETLNLLQNKLEKLSKESIVSEMKMKEIITNLQEVRTNQDAVLITQEKALKEKCLHLEQLRKEFSESKRDLFKELENEKLSRKNLQSTNSELQIQSYKQQKIIEELQEVLKSERAELDESKRYRKIEDTRQLKIVQICKELEQSTNDLKLTIVETSQNNEKLYSDIAYDIQCVDIDNKTNSILKTVNASMSEIHASRKLILHLYNTNTNLNQIVQTQKVIVDNYATKCEDIKALKNKVEELEHVQEKHLNHLKNLIKHKELLKAYLQNFMKSREDLDILMHELQQKWNALLTKFYSIFTADRSVCDELKYIQSKKIQIENILSNYSTNYLQNMKPLYTILWQIFVWTDEKLDHVYSCSASKEQILDISSGTSLHEKTLIETEVHKNGMLQKDIIQSQNEIESFCKLVTSLEVELKSNETKFQSEVEKKLQLQISELMEDKDNIRSKLDCARMKSAKLEGHIDELRSKIEELKATSSKDTESIKKEVIQFKEENLKLLEEREELSKRPKKEDMDNQLKEMHDKYKVKVDEIKQNMKTAYNEQLAKLNKEQEQCIQETLESLQKKMEQQCRKQADELSKYKAHVSRMSAQFWNIGEKLLTEQKEKEHLQKQLTELKAKYQNVDPQIVSSIEHKSAKYEKSDLLSGSKKEEVLHKVSVIQEKTTYERCIRSIQAMGNAFYVEDEQGEVFDNIYLADMKDGHSTFNTDTDRLSILKKRNALCKPHLKSSYPAEMQFHPLSFTEEEIKSGSVADDIFNDSLSQSLLPEQKTKKKDRTQTSYKKHGPPTPSKNGGRLSLQGNELRSPNSRILRERNKERTTATPRSLKSLFSSKRQDENVTVTPRSRRRSSIFRKYRSANDR